MIISLFSYAMNQDHWKLSYKWERRINEAAHKWEFIVVQKFPERMFFDWTPIIAIFDAKIFFAENRVFSIFAKELDKKFIFLKKKSIVQKRKMNRIFRRQVRENGTEITTVKICLKKTKKNRGIFGGFLRNFRKLCLLPLHVDARSAENIRLIFHPISKN